MAADSHSEIYMGIYAVKTRSTTHLEASHREASHREASHREESHREDYLTPLTLASGACVNCLTQHFALKVISLMDPAKLRQGHADLASLRVIPLDTAEDHGATLGQRYWRAGTLS
ncbi:hypothetical protein NFJ02_37g94800 [Pycnococcus provasolii]